MEVIIVLCLAIAREASHPGEHDPDLDKRFLSELRPQKGHLLAARDVVTKFVDGAHRLLHAPLACGLLVADRALAHSLSLGLVR